MPSGAAPAGSAQPETVPLPVVRFAVSKLRTISAASGVSLGLLMAGCGSGDSTVAKTPTPTSTPPSSTVLESTAAVTTSSATATSTEPPPADPCAVNLTTPAIAQAVSTLPPDPRSEQGWNPEPLEGNFNECAQLSAVIIKANTNAENPSTRALFFHLGQFIPKGVPDTFGFNGLDPAQSTGDTVALSFTSGATGLKSVVKFRWNGNGVELIGNTG